MPTEFDSLVSLNDWSSKLAELLARSRAALELEESDRLAVARRLTDFVAHSYPASPEIKRLDEIASSAARALAEQIARDAVERLASRSALLELLSGELATIRREAHPRQNGAGPRIAVLARDLATAAEDARSLLGSPFEPTSPDTQARIDRLGRTIAALQAAFQGLVTDRTEPGSVPPGTVMVRKGSL